MNCSLGRYLRSPFRIAVKASLAFLLASAVSMIACTSPLQLCKRRLGALHDLSSWPIRCLRIPVYPWLLRRLLTWVLLPRGICIQHCNHVWYDAAVASPWAL